MTDKILITLGVIIIVLLIITMILATKKRDNYSWTDSNFNVIPMRVNADTGPLFTSYRMQDPMMALGPNQLKRIHYSNYVPVHYSNHIGKEST